MSSFGFGTEKSKTTWHEDTAAVAENIKISAQMLTERGVKVQVDPLQVLPLELGAQTLRTFAEVSMSIQNIGFKPSTNRLIEESVARLEVASQEFGLRSVERLQVNIERLQVTIERLTSLLFWIQILVLLFVFLYCLKHFAII